MNKETRYPQDDYIFSKITGSGPENQVKDCRTCGRTKKDCEDLMCHDRDQWQPKKEPIERVKTSDGLSPAQLLARIMREAHLSMVRPDRQEEKARQATIRFVKKEISKNITDTSLIHMAGLSFGVVCYFGGYLEALKKYEPFIGKN